eukprot:TRINITY_DN344_c0_g1_i1.p1 TRINITY_DN344_c0_g1~~TRINITY_DN344_c0_g1_i1.p1  ORF type:complete len:662 (+),score=216.02 TRINITY_DN344_c0_g1_i1:58-2043(+)
MTSNYFYYYAFRAGVKPDDLDKGLKKGEKPEKDEKHAEKEAKKAEKAEKKAEKAEKKAEKAEKKAEKAEKKAEKEEKKQQKKEEAEGSVNAPNPFFYYAFRAGVTPDELDKDAHKAAKKEKKEEEKKEEVKAEEKEEKDEKKEKKDRKKEEKEKKKAEKEEKKQERGRGRQEPEVASKVNANDFNTDTFGDLPLVQSQYETTRTFTHVIELNASLVGKNVWVRARLHNSRAKGKTCFLVLREQSATVQAAMFVGDSIPKEMVKYASNISKESIVDVFATVAAAKVESTSQKDIELSVIKIFAISNAVPQLPFQIEDAARPEIEGQEEDESRPRVNQDTRLDYRWIDLRTPANQSIMRIQSAVGLLFREYLYSQGFIEIHSPKLIGGSSEGGANVFRLKYFNVDACLAQSPQLYKQMAICSDLNRVFEIGPVFRAEDSNTHRHMTEFVGLDMEMAFNENYIEVVDVLEQMFLYIFDGLNQRYSKEMEVISQQYPFEPLLYTKPTLRLNYPEAVKMLRDAGVEIGDFDDLSTVQEKTLGRLVKEKYGTEFYVLLRYPADARPFYTMPCPDDERYTNSYDWFLRGEEITSGSQRVHDPAMLEKRARAKGIDVATIDYYINSFRHGAPPHGGAGIGLERVVMLFLGLHNIRKTSMFPRDPKRLTP